VIDNGHPFDPSAVPEPDVSLPLEQRDPGGLGILLIHRMVDRVDYRRVADENRLRLKKSRN
jgi:anti-sigma regulatory factor (Ser/Thr protein kinase)